MGKPVKTSVIARCTHANPQERFRSAAELCHQLETITRVSKAPTPAMPPDIRAAEMHEIHEGTRFVVFRGQWSGRPAVVKSVTAQAFIPSVAVDGKGRVGVLWDDFRRDRS